MSFSSNSNSGMGRTSREQSPREGGNSEENVDPNDDGPIDLSMPRYPNRMKEVRPSNSYFGAVRNKSSSSYDVDINEQPIDYSKKYVESNSLSSIKTNYVPRNSLSKAKVDNGQREKPFSQQDSKADPYGDYAETDLDQPTDYSLRYAEDDTDDEEKQNNAYFTGNEQEDTVKTYCTEGTPYETPFNVSTATSMSDLRLEDAKDGETSKRILRKIIIQDSRNGKDTMTKIPTSACTEEYKEKQEKEEQEEEILTKESKNLNNELVLNSSSASIEKPINYYDEGTPGRISRVSSLSSLGCANGQRNEDVEEIVERIEVQTTPALPVSPIPSVESNREEAEVTVNALVVVDDSIRDEEAAISGPDEEKGDARVVDKEGKVVTFGGEDHYAEQTPLMFSRSSSLGSLSGFEQHSIHDDRSSIVSDFSRRTSGVVSPSELPDSPTQTVPPSPRHNHNKSTTDLTRRPPPQRYFSYVKSPRGKSSSVFEDNVAAFKEESTPMEFSAATSLSSLTIDDEPKIIMDSKEKVYPEKARTVGRLSVDNSVEVKNSKIDEVERVELVERENERTEQEQVSDGDEDDEDILAACISMGMRNSMYRQSFKKISDIPDKVSHRMTGGDSTTNLVRYQTSSTLDRLVADVSTLSLSPTKKTKNSLEVAAVPPDTIRVYCTEDTPADISPVGSQSNLSALSMLSISDDMEKEEKNRLSLEDDDSWVLSGDDEKILDDCIRSGIARARQGTNSFPGTASVTEFHSPSHASSTKRTDSYLPRPIGTREIFSISTSNQAQSKDIPIRSTSSPRSNSAAVEHDRIVYDDSPNHSEDEAILAQCIQSAMPKGTINSLSFAKSQASRKTPEPPSTHTNLIESTSFSSTRGMSQVFRTSATRLSITATDKNEEPFGDNSSLSEEEEDLILAQCIRSGMPKASSMPPKDTNYQREERRSREQ